MPFSKAPFEMFQCRMRQLPTAFVFGIIHTVHSGHLTARRYIQSKMCEVGARNIWRSDGILAAEMGSDVQGESARDGR